MATTVITKPLTSNKFSNPIGAQGKWQSQAVVYTAVAYTKTTGWSVALHTPVRDWRTISGHITSATGTYRAMPLTAADLTLPRTVTLYLFGDGAHTHDWDVIHNAGGSTTDDGWSGASVSTTSVSEGVCVGAADLVIAASATSGAQTTTASELQEIESGNISGRLFLNWLS